MSHVKHSEWLKGGTLLSNWFEDMRFFNSPFVSGRNIPAVNVRENKKHYVAASGLQAVSAERREKKEDINTGIEFGFSSAFI